MCYICECIDLFFISQINFPDIYSWKQIKRFFNWRFWDTSVRLTMSKAEGWQSKLIASWSSGIGGGGQGATYRPKPVLRVTRWRLVLWHTQPESCFAYLLDISQASNTDNQIKHHKCNLLSYPAHLKLYLKHSQVIIMPNLVHINKCMSCFPKFLPFQYCSKVQTKVFSEAEHSYLSKLAKFKK